MATISYINATPIMTSNILPSPNVASASSISSTTYDAWKAFNNVNDGQGWLSANNTFPQWIQIKLASAKIIGKYTLRVGTNVNEMAKDWTLQGSNDGSSWTVLDTRTGQTSWVSNEKREYIFDNNTTYQYYRVNITAHNGNANYVGISEIEIMEKITTFLNKFLILSEDLKPRRIDYELGGKAFDAVYKGAGVTLSNNNDTASITGLNDTAVGDKAISKGKFYWEFFVNTISYQIMGVIKDGENLSSMSYNTGKSRLYYYTGTKWTTSSLAYGASYTTNDVISVLLDMDVGTIEFWKNGVSQGVASTDLLTLVSVRPSFTRASSSGTGVTTIRTMESEFTYPVPSGYLAYGEDIQTDITQTPVQDEQVFISHGMNDISKINPRKDFTKKKYINNQSTVLGVGKTIEHDIDLNKYKVNKITFQ